MICKNLKQCFSCIWGFFSEIVHHKLDIVMQGQQMLSERWGRFEDRVEKRMDALEHSIMSVDVNLTKRIDAC
jgi:hypothetical protein